MVKAKCFLAVVAVECVVLLALFAHESAVYQVARAEEVKAKTVLVDSLGLTDFAIWTEARYTRHPSQTDFFSAFQDFPGAPDHFPAGSILAPRNYRPGEGQ